MNAVSPASCAARPALSASCFCVCACVPHSGALVCMYVCMYACVHVSILGEGEGEGEVIYQLPFHPILSPTPLLHQASINQSTPPNRAKTSIKRSQAHPNRAAASILVHVHAHMHREAEGPPFSPPPTENRRTRFRVLCGLRILRIEIGKKRGRGNRHRGRPSPLSLIHI